MTEKHQDIIKKAEEYATTILKQEVSDKMVYHSLEHTRNVVKAADEIAKNSGLNEDEYEIVLISAWFHDLGYSEGVVDHEEISRQLARDFLIAQDYDHQKRKKVEDCILATKMPQNPKNKLEQILCDADMVHLGREDYLNRAELLRQEIQNVNGKEIDKLSWLRMSQVFMKDHSFFTEYARTHFSPRAEDNLRTISEEIRKVTSEQEEDEPEEVKKIRKKLEKAKKKAKKAKEQKPTRGIETMFRLASKNHIDLSAMADTKANIMISINSIILSVIVSLLIRKLEEYPHFTIPGLILTVVCLVTIVFSILATRPNVPQGTFTEQDIHDKKTNLLFFGNFHRSDLDIYLWGMKEMMKDADYLYSSLIRDLYFLGVVLGKKYRLLRIAYTIFMYGFVISIISFIVAQGFFAEPYPY